MKKNLWVIRYRKPLIAITILLSLGSIIPITQNRINSDLESYMPESMQSKINNKLISEHFSNDEILMLVLECENILSEKTLQRIENISSAFEQSNLFGRVYSVFQVKDIVSDEGMMLVNPLIEKIPKDEGEQEQLRQRIKGNDLAYRLVVSEDFRFTLIILTKEKSSDDDTIIAFINQTLKQFPGSEKMYLTGQPVLRAEANANISRDIIILLPAGLILMLFMLWLSFRDIRLVLLPFSIVLISMIVALALIPALGWELSLIGILIPIMMIAIANNYGIHFIAGYQEIHARYPGRSHTKVIQTLLNNLRKPVILCGLTTMVGVLGLLAHLFEPAKQMGVVSSIAIGFALLLSLTFLPAVLSFFPGFQHHKPEKARKNGFFEHWLYFAGNITTQHPKRVISAFVLFFVLIGGGILRMKIAPDSNKILPEKHPFNQAIALADNHFGGSKQISIMFDGEVTNPGLLRQIDSVSTVLRNHRLIGNTTSLATIIRNMSKAMNDPGDRYYNRIPESGNTIAQYLELYAMSADISDFEQFLSFDYQHTLLTVQYQTATLKESEEVLQFIRNTLNGVDFPFTIGGMSLIDMEISESVRNGQLYSLLAALLAIIILLSLIFRHVGAGIAGGIPLIFAVICTFGFMGWAGIELNIVTALLSSISIGLGVDFSIHLFWRLRSELQHNSDTGLAIRKAIAGVGRGISVNALSVMLGFSVLFLSSFPFIRSFALLIVLSLLFCLISALVLMPAICMLLKPSFLIKNERTLRKINN